MLSVPEQKSIIKQLFQNNFEAPILAIENLPVSGSDRKYYRLKLHHKSVLGVYNPIKEENIAFLSFSRQFLKNGLKVPQILVEDLDNDIYIIEDFGDTTLFSLLPGTYEPTFLNDGVIEVYKKVLNQLPYFQIYASKNLDFSVCFPRNVFDRQSMMWDANYFKYYFLKLAGIQYDEQLLEEDFNTLCDFLGEVPAAFFMYRDFQSRNIMIQDGEPRFIDYQGGRRGALQYDLASLLYDAKANIPPAQREELLQFYLQELKKHIEYDEQAFCSYFYGFVLIRIMQAMGAYGFRGFFEKKSLFLQSIPYAKRNLLWLLQNNKIPNNLNYLKHIVEQIIHSDSLKKYDKPATLEKELVVKIRSFSYKKGYPADHSPNGGGFVFDCRFLPNPGREEKYKRLSGLNQEVIEYLQKENAVNNFVENTTELVEKAIENYMERNFNSLMISYGCTGGQHRSVYSAEKLAKRIKEKYNVTIDLQHTERQNWPQ